MLDLAACEKRIDDTAILLETEIVQLPRVVNNPPQRQASLVKIQELLKSFATSYRALEDIVNDSYDVNVRKAEIGKVFKQASLGDCFLQGRQRQVHRRTAQEGRPK